MSRRADHPGVAGGGRDPGGRADALAHPTKPDHSPVTAADDAADAVILARGRAAAARTSGRVGGSRGGAAAVTSGDTFALVDPARRHPGVRRRAGTSTPSTWRSLPTAGRSLGIIAAPAFGLIWRAAEGRAPSACGLRPVRRASRPPNRLSSDRPGPRPASSLRSAARISTPHHSALLARLPIAERVACGSAIKFCRVAEGAADVYPRLSPGQRMGHRGGPCDRDDAGGSDHRRRRCGRCATGGRRAVSGAGLRRRGRPRRGCTPDDRSVGSVPAVAIAHRARTTAFSAMIRVGELASHVPGMR